MAVLTNAAVLPAIMALNGLMDEKLPVRTAFKIRKLHRALSAQWEIVEEVRKSLIEQSVLRDAAGNPVPGEEQRGQPTVRLRPEAIPHFEAQWRDLMDAPVDVGEGIRIEELGDREISPALLLNLGDLLAE